MPRRAWKGDDGSALAEFAVALPLLVVFIVGIYDFSGAFNQKQKLEHAAQEGAVSAAAQPMTDIDPTNGNPASLLPVLTVIFNSLANSNVLPLGNQGSCLASAAVPVAPVPPAVQQLQWTYTISGCPDTLTIVINRGWVPASITPPAPLGTAVTVSYPYHWKFNSVIQLVGGTFVATTDLTETSTVHNQM